RGGEGVQVYLRRHERRTDPCRLRLDGRRKVVRREGGRLLEPARGLRPADRGQRGGAVRDRPRPHGGGGGGADVQQGRRARRRERALRARGQHRQVPGGGGGGG